MHTSSSYDTDREFAAMSPYVAAPRSGDSSATLPETSREELFMALQKGAEESRTARQRAVDRAKTALDGAGS